ncbi:MAG: hypothetical protein K6F99_02665 [Lachnospiraceae bacterium]|nr:hypothetical protein [Lachnospiraceae bacterium]
MMNLISPVANAPTLSDKKFRHNHDEYAKKVGRSFSGKKSNVTWIGYSAVLADEDTTFERRA